jgi:hypothetical protein
MSDPPGSSFFNHESISILSEWTFYFFGDRVSGADLCEGVMLKRIFPVFGAILLLYVLLLLVHPDSFRAIFETRSISYVLSMMVLFCTVIIIKFADPGLGVVAAFLCTLLSLLPVFFPSVTFAWYTNSILVLIPTAVILVYRIHHVPAECVVVTPQGAYTEGMKYVYVPYLMEEPYILNLKIELGLTVPLTERPNQPCTDITLSYLIALHPEDVVRKMSVISRQRVTQHVEDVEDLAQDVLRKYIAERTERAFGATMLLVAQALLEHAQHIPLPSYGPKSYLLVTEFTAHHRGA